MKANIEQLEDANSRRQKTCQARPHVRAKKSSIIRTASKRWKGITKQPLIVYADAKNRQKTNTTQTGLKWQIQTRQTEKISQHK